MASKIIAQLIIAGTQILGRAFVDAYRQAAANAAKNGGQTAAKAASSASGSTASSALNELTRKTGMSFEEATKILNVDRGAAEEAIKKNYEHLFNANDKKSGGSFYLQSKVVRAKERIDMELALEKEHAVDVKVEPPSGSTKPES